MLSLIFKKNANTQLNNIKSVLALYFSMSLIGLYHTYIFLSINLSILIEICMYFCEFLLINFMAFNMHQF